eukprot:Awhi_evm2s6036
MAAPINSEQVKSVLQSLNYWHNYLPNLAVVTAPLSALVKKNVRFQWTEKELECWMNIKKLINANLTLEPLNCEKELFLHTDASDKEGLAVCWAALKFTPLILQCPQLIVDTDHEALLGVYANLHLEDTVRGRRIYRYQSIMSNFNWSLRRKNYALVDSYEVVTKPMQRLGMDTVSFPSTKLGNCLVLLVIDNFSRFVWAKAFKSIRAVDVKEFLSQIFLFGVPNEIFADRAQIFLDTGLKSFLKKYSCTIVYAPPDHHESNGLAETTAGSLVLAMRKQTHELDSEWDNLLLDWNLSNNALVCVNGFSPHLIMTQRNSTFDPLARGDDELIVEAKDPESSLVSFSDVLVVNQNLKEKHINVHNYNVIKSAVTIKVSDRVYYQSPVEYNQDKLAMKWFGPCEVLAVLPNERFSLSYEARIIERH